MTGNEFEIKIKETMKVKSSTVVSNMLDIFQVLKRLEARTHHNKNLTACTTGEQKPESKFVKTNESVFIGVTIVLFFGMRAY